MSTKFEKNESRTKCPTGSPKLVRNPQRMAKATAPIRSQNDYMESEHFWELFPVSMYQDSTHTLLEVIHSSNREHRHKLTSDSEPGYYIYLWPLIILNDLEALYDFDDLLMYHYSIDCHGIGLMLAGRTFSRKDFSQAVEKSLRIMAEITELGATLRCHEEEDEY